jgi:hypothetical protein
VSSTDDRVPAGPEPRRAEGAGQGPDSAAGSAQAAAPDTGGSPAPAAVAPPPGPAAGEQTALASAPPTHAAPAGASQASGASQADTHPDGSAGGPRPLGWVIGAVIVVAVAWLVTAVLSYWTSYATLTVTRWEAFTYGTQSAKISILVHNSGTAEASGCTVFLQLDPGTVDSYQGPHELPIPVDGTKWLVIPYRTGSPAPTAPSYAWAQCGRARSPRMRVGTLHDIALLTSNPAVTVSQSGDLVLFQVHNRGTQTATGCRAYVKLTNRRRSFGSSTIQPDVSGGSTRQFAVQLRTPAGFGTPKLAWAYCLDGTHGIITSSRVHF